MDQNRGRRRTRRCLVPGSAKRDKQRGRNHSYRGSPAAGRTRSRAPPAEPAARRGCASRHRREEHEVAVLSRDRDVAEAAHAKIGDAGRPRPRDRRSYACYSPVCTCAIARCRTGHPAQVTMYSLAPIVPVANATEGGNRGTQRIHLCAPRAPRRPMAHETGRRTADFAAHASPPKRDTPVADKSVDLGG